MAFFNVGGSAGGGSGIDVSELIKLVDFQKWGNANGGRMLPDGFFIQHGRAAGKTSGLSYYTFPKAFPNACAALVCSLGSNYDTQATIRALTVDNARFQMAVIGDNDQPLGLNVHWIAVGLLGGIL